MKSLKKTLSMLLVLAMAMSCLGAAAPELQDAQESEQDQQSETVEVQPSEPAEPAGEEQPDGSAEPAGDQLPQTPAETADEPDGADQVLPEGEPADGADGQVKVLSADEPAPISVFPDQVTKSVYMADMVYGDEAPAPVASISGPELDYGKPTFTYAKKDSGTAVEAEDLPKADAGEYTVMATWGSETAEGTFQILKRPVTVFVSKHVGTSGVSDNKVTLTADDQYSIVSPKGLVNDDVLTVQSVEVKAESTPKTYTEINGDPSYTIMRGSKDVKDNYAVTVLAAVVVEDTSSADYTPSVTLEGWVYGEQPVSVEPKAEVTNGSGKVNAKTGPTFEYYKPDGNKIESFPPSEQLAAGTYTVVAKWEADWARSISSAPALTATSTFTVSKRPATLKSPDHEFTYSGEAQYTTEDVTKETGSTGTGRDFLSTDAENIEIKNYGTSGVSITDVRESGKLNTFTYEAKSGHETVLNNYEIEAVYGKLTMKPIEVEATVKGTKPFGSKDSAATYEISFDHEEEVKIIGDDKDDVKALIKPEKIQRDQDQDGEAAGKKYKVTGEKIGEAEKANYTVTVTGTLEIKTEGIQWVPVIEADKVDTHTDTLKFDIEPAKGVLAELLEPEKLAGMLEVSLHAAVPADVKYAPASIPDMKAGDDGTVTVDPVNYSDGSGHSWQSYLPAGTVLTMQAKLKGTSDVIAESEPVTVSAVNASMAVSPAGGAAAAVDEGTRLLLDAAGTVTVAPSSADDAKYIGADDWIVLTVGEAQYLYSAADTSELSAAAGGPAAVTDGALTLTLAQLKALAGAGGEEGPWFGAAPAGSLVVSAKLLDQQDHNSELDSKSIAFDTGVKATTQTVENRAEEITITLDEEAVSATVEGTFGGSTPEITADGTKTLTWTNIADWKNYPDNLPHSGDTITITYKDRLGNEGTHTLNVVKSQAATNTTIYVKPMTDNTVPSGKLSFYGGTNVWETMDVTVGGTSFTVSPIPGGSTYDNSSRQWSLAVDLSQIDFPVGEPTQASIAYDDLIGGTAAIVITYKDEAQEPVMGCEAVAGGTALWGYVESSASVMIDIRHADGSVTAVPAANVAVDQFGYFYARLNAPLAEGDVAVITTTDFCGNVKRIEKAAQTQLPAGAAAQVLGANIIGRTLDGRMEHRFATPVDLSALGPDQSLTLPILAYKGIEVGTVDVSLDEQGAVKVGYNISASSFIGDSAAARASVYTWKPDIQELVAGSHDTAVEDLKAAPSGQLISFDASRYQADDGSYSGVIWLYTEFDVKMDTASYVDRGGRSVSFYRWLTENLQTESLLNAVYSEMAAYEKNVEYYGLYQRFESISRTY